MANVDRGGGLWARRAIDALAYVVVVTVAFAVLSAIGALLLGGDLLLGVKRGLFLLGWLALLAGVIAARPKRWHQRVREQDDAADERHEPGRRGASGRRGDDHERRSYGSHERRSRRSGNPGASVASEPPIDRVAQRLLPPGVALAPDQRLPKGVKLILSGLAVHLVSFVMEAVFGVVP